MWVHEFGAGEIKLCLIRAEDRPNQLSYYIFLLLTEKMHGSSVLKSVPHKRKASFLQAHMPSIGDSWSGKKYITYTWTR